MTTRRLVVLGATAALATGRLSAPVRAQAAGEAPGVSDQTIALGIARSFVIPRLQTLTTALITQAAAWDAFSASPRSNGLPQLEAAFHAAADAWSGVEAVRDGPAGEDLRYERMAHWPERKGAVSKAVSALLADTEEITPERLRRASVAGQGLSALERLLFGEIEGGAAKAERDLFDASAAGQRRRSLGRAVAQGLARTAADTLQGWTAPDGQLARLERAGPDAAKQAVTRFVTDHLALLQAVAEAKVGAVLGKTPDEARPLIAEGWRSGRTLRAIRINLDAADAFSRAALAHDAKASRSVLAGLDTARSVAADLAAGQASLSALAADPKRRMRAVLLRDAVLSARESSGPALAEALRITIGFNSRDGD